MSILCSVNFYYNYRILKGNPKPNITWQYKRDDLEFATLPQDVRIENSTDNAMVVMRNVSVNHEGLYRCVAENIIGRDVFDFVLTVQCKYTSM